MDTTVATKLKANATLRESALTVLIRLWPVIFLIAMVSFFSIQKPAFFTVFNLGNILVTSTLVMLMGVGQTFVIITGGIDLSVGWTVGLSAVIAAEFMRNSGNAGIDPGLSILFGVLAGLAVSIVPGVVNGLLVAKIKVPPFIATLGMYGVVRGAAFLLTDGKDIVGDLPSNVRDMATNIGNGSLLYYIPGQGLAFTVPSDLPLAQARSVANLLPYPVIFAAVVILILAFVLARTRFGRHTYAIGGNLEAARRAGITVDRNLIAIYIISAFTAGVAGVFHVFRYGAGAPNAGEAALLDSVAAVVIGGTSLLGGEGSIRGTVIGAVIFAVLQTGLVFLVVPGLWQFVIVGLIIIIAVLINRAQSYLEKQRVYRMAAQMEEE